jgi:hypothetical protein
VGAVTTGDMKFAAALFGVAAWGVLIVSLAFLYGYEAGERRACERQFGGVLIEGKCIRRDSLKAVEP